MKLKVVSSRRRCWRIINASFPNLGLSVPVAVLCGTGNSVEGGVPPLMFCEPQAGLTRHYFGANPSIPDADIRARVQQLPYPIDLIDVSPIMHHMLSPARVSAIVGFGSRPLQWNALTDDSHHGSACSSPPYQLCNSTYWALAFISAWRLARQTRSKYQ